MHCVTPTTYFPMMFLDISRENIWAKINPFSNFHLCNRNIFLILQKKLNKNHFSLIKRRDYGQIYKGFLRDRHQPLDLNYSNNVLITSSYDNITGNIYLPCYSLWCVPQPMGSYKIILTGQRKCLHTYVYHQLRIWMIVINQVYILIWPRVSYQIWPPQA